jgi:serpin B
MVDLPYGNGAFSMSVLLPETEDAIPTAEDWAELTGNLQNKKVNLYLPKFTFETTMDLIETMKAMGMPTAFSTSADFSQLADESLYISLLKQKTYVSVDESGTEAAAVTSTGMMTTAVVPVDDTQPILFEANRPFTFVIRERSTGVILFMGYVEQL